MAESTVNERRFPKEITDTDGIKDEKIEVCYINLGPNEKCKIRAKKNEKKPSIPFIETSRRDGQIVNETAESAIFRAYGMYKEKKDSDKMSKKEKEIKGR